MICRNCNMRYAHFPEEDYSPDGKPKNKDAENKRLIVYFSDDISICSPECENAEITKILNTYNYVLTI